MLFFQVFSVPLLLTLSRWAYANPAELCGDDVVKYIQCVQNEYGNQLDKVSLFDEVKVRRELNECFTKNNCPAPPENVDAVDESIAKTSADAAPSADGKASAVDTLADEAESDDVDAEPFQTKTVLNEKLFPGSKGQEYNNTMRRCLQKAEEDQKQTLLTCMRRTLPAFQYPQEGSVPRIQDFLNAAVKGLQSRREDFEIEASAVFYYLAEIKSSCTSWPKINKCLAAVFKQSEDTTYDIIEKSEEFRSMWCKIHGGCLKSTNVKCHKVIESIKQIECDCLRGNQKNFVEAIAKNYEKCLGYKLKTIVIEDKVKDTMEDLCGIESIPPECTK